MSEASVESHSVTFLGAGRVRPVTERSVREIECEGVFLAGFLTLQGVVGDLRTPRVPLAAGEVARSGVPLHPELCAAIDGIEKALVFLRRAREMGKDRFAPGGMSYDRPVPTDAMPDRRREALLGGAQ